MGLVIGYFAGREHIKYELRTAFQSAAQQVQQQLAGITKPAVTAPAQTAPVPPSKPAEPSPLSITLVTKGFHASNPQAGDFEDDITFKLSFKNPTGKDIRAFDGTLTFTDLLDNEVLSSDLAINDPVPIGAPVSWEGGIKYNQFMDRHQRLLSMHKGNLKIVFAPHKILFADGTTNEY
jgi:hypothetical protein